jgi:DNA topoisomerase I
MPESKKVVLAYPYTDEDGELHKADKSIDLPTHEANRLIHAGLARDPEPKTAKKTAAKKTAAKKTAAKKTTAKKTTAKKTTAPPAGTQTEES